MQVNDATVAGVPVLHISGSLADSHGFKELQALVRKHLDQRCRRLIVELQDVSGLDAVGLTTLLAVLTHAGADSRVVRVAQVGVDDLPLPKRIVVEFDDTVDVHPGGPGLHPLMPSPDTTARAIVLRRIRSGSGMPSRRRRYTPPVLSFQPAHGPPSMTCISCWCSSSR